MGLVMDEFVAARKHGNECSCPGALKIIPNSPVVFREEDPHGALAGPSRSTDETLWLTDSLISFRVAETGATQTAP